MSEETNVETYAGSRKETLDADEWARPDGWEEDMAILASAAWSIARSLERISRQLERDGIQVIVNQIDASD